MTKQRSRYLKIGLTGGIGSGKSTVAGRFEALGARVYHADEISRRALDPGAVCYDRVVSLFGQQIVRPDGTIDRRKLGEIVFADEQKRMLLNEIIHPYVIETMFSQLEQDFAGEVDGIAVFEVPLLFESGLNARMDRNIVVSSTEENRIRRVMERDHLPREHVLSRMYAQMPEEEKRLLADYILDNDGTVEDLFSQADELFALIKAGGLRD
jgi:dephospho-CoA kinase